MYRYDRLRKRGRTPEGRIEIALCFRDIVKLRSIGCFCTPGIIRAATLTMSHTLCNTTYLSAIRWNYRMLMGNEKMVPHVVAIKEPYDIKSLNHI